MSKIVIAGAGYVGLETAQRLEQRLPRGAAEVTIVNPENFHLFRPLLPEVASGSIEPRHAVVPLRQALPRTRVLCGRLTSLDRARRRAGIRTAAGTDEQLEWDHLVLGLGSMTKVMPVPGLLEHALGFSSIGEALGLRNHVLRCLEKASAVRGTDRQRLLTFVFVGGGYTGVEALAELHDMACDVLEGYPELDRSELHFVLVEATDRLLPTVSQRLAGHAQEVLEGRGIDVRLGTALEHVEDGSLRLSDGTELPQDTLVWVAGMVPHAVVAELGLPVDDKGRLQVDERLRVCAPDGAVVDGIWSAGDCAAVPDLVTGGTCPPTAQYAVREGRHLGENLASVLRGEQPAPFRHRSMGEFITLGMRRGIAEIRGHPVGGFAAWALRRGYYGTQIPTLNRKLRLMLDWSVRMPFGHDVVDLSSEQDPQAAFREAVDSA